MPNFADYIFNRALNLGLPGVYVGIVNNITLNAYKAGPTASDGLFAWGSNPPAGLYTVYISPTGSGLPPGGDWTATGETGYAVPPAAPVANTDLAGPLLNAITAGSNLSVGAAPGGVGAQSVALISNPTLSGLLTAQAGLTLTGLLTMLDAVSRVIPGATSWAVRNNANNADNLILTDAGLATLRNLLTITAGGLTVAAGGASITGATLLAGLLKAGGNTPVANTNVNANVVANPVVSGFDLTHKVVFTTQTGTIGAGSKLFTVTLGTTYATQLIPVGIGANAGAATWSFDLVPTAGNTYDVYNITALGVASGWQLDVITAGW